MYKILMIKGRVRLVRVSKQGRGYPIIYVYKEHGGLDLAKYAGREVDAMVVIQLDDEEDQPKEDLNKESLNLTWLKGLKTGHS